ncbi:MAG: hypothetical protein EBX90_11275 [Betaproteobacteria bacterium]|nr:hypothetical protein [Betaproteobacteria bacterium]
MAQAKTLTEGEIQKLLDHIATKPNARRNRVMFLLTVWAGLRVSEVAALKLSDVRNKDGSIRGEIYLDASRVKHGHAGVVFLNARLQGQGVITKRRFNRHFINPGHTTSHLPKCATRMIVTCAKVQLKSDGNRQMANRQSRHLV